MDNLLKSVDIAQVEIHEQAVYYIEGWVIPEPEQSFRLEIRFDGEVIPAEVKFRARPDLGNVLKETKIPEKPGFSIYVPEVSWKNITKWFFIWCAAIQKNCFLRRLRRR